MESNQKGFDPLESFTPQQIADLGQSINTLEQEEKRILQEEQESRANISDGQVREKMVSILQ